VPGRINQIAMTTERQTAASHTSAALATCRRPIPVPSGQKPPQASRPFKIEPNFYAQKHGLTCLL
jgi:hypothetical protein